jgi:hypothetical protein
VAQGIDKKRKMKKNNTWRRGDGWWRGEVEKQEGGNYKEVESVKGEEWKEGETEGGGEEERGV